MLWFIFGYLDENEISKVMKCYECLKYAFIEVILFSQIVSNGSFVQSFSTVQKLKAQDYFIQYGFTILNYNYFQKLCSWIGFKYLLGTGYVS